MEDDSWAVSSSCSSRSHRSTTTATKYHQSGYVDFEGDYEEDEDDVAVDYYPCPFCSDDYDLVELCHHIDEEHQLEANHGICPVCSKRVKMHMVDHITTHHRDILKSGEKQISSYGEGEGEEEDSYYRSDKYLHSSNKTVVSDQFLSFINNSTLPNQTKLSQQLDESSVEEDKSIVKDSSIEKGLKSLSVLSDSEQLEKAKKCEYVQGLLASAMFDDDDDDDWM